MVVGHACFIELGTGKTIHGVISTMSKYWYLVNADGQITIVNKAYVVSITPVQPQNNKQSVNTLVGASVVPYGEKKA